MKKWEEYSDQHPIMAAILVMGFMALALWIFTLTGRQNTRKKALKVVQEQAQAAGLENVQTESTEPSERGVAYVTLSADKPENMNMKDLHEILLEIKAQDEDSPNWKIDRIYINGKQCYAGDDKMVLGGRAVYKTPELRAKERRIASGKPYVGMDVKYIEGTSLGEATEKEYQWSRRPAGFSSGYVTYIWCNEKRQTIFTATVKSIKDEVGIQELEVVDVQEYIPPKNNNSSYGSYSYTPSSGQSGDKYNAKKYKTSEDFYDDNYDNFFSYEDAESYYNKHK